MRGRLQRSAATQRECEKLLGQSGPDADGGVSRRAGAQILTWLAERRQDPDDRGYVIGTMNTVKGLPPEFFRRFDAVFATDLPTAAVRREILRSHLTRRGVEPAAVRDRGGAPLDEAAWAELAQRCAGFLGSEVEDVVIQARSLAAARAAAAPDFEDLWAAADERRRSCVAATHPADLAEVLAYTRRHCRPVYEGPDSPEPLPQPPPGAPAGRIVD